ncbi:MAG: DUF4080 domain-containing protein [Proteobacteria bacterium]|nr:DUF4080 domain-containing protein [Pseudomonadota bacterium]MBU1138588.1 DUF4080 domain-containing protein [Pseudomonadota bacterium]
MHIKLVAINGRFTHSSLALFHVRNELEEQCPGVSTEILQLTIRDPYYEVLLHLSRNEPDAIFFSAAVWNSERVQELICDLHSLLPSCLLVVGGPQAEVVGGQCGGEVCTVVRGAVEAVEKQFYDDLLKGTLGPRYGRSFFHMAEKRFFSPYREEDFSSHLRNRNIYYESSRGCPFSCTYCLSSAESGIVHKGLDQVRWELDQIMAHGPTVLRFVDRTFNDIPERALALWQLVLGYESETLFHFEVAPDRFSEEMFALLATIPPGRFQFEIGIQSTHEPTLAAIKRRIDPRVAHETVSRLAALDTIHLHVDLILGLPYETEKSYLQSFADVFAMGSHYIQMGILKLLPDTAISRDADFFAYRACRRPPYTVLANQWLDPECLQRLYWFSECVERFCNNRYFPSLWNYLRRKGENSSAFFCKLLESCHEYRLFHLAVTHEILCTIITASLEGREDRSLILQLLSYDWLRCGYRNLPSCLLAAGCGEERQDLKDRLYQQLPADLSGLYTKKERNRFFRQSVFHQFSEACLQELGFENRGTGCLVFLQERENTLLRLNRALLLPSCSLPGKGM